MNFWQKIVWLFLAAMTLVWGGLFLLLVVPGKKRLENEKGIYD